MSYNCEINFKKIKPEDIMDFLVEIKKSLTENLKDIAEENCIFCPFNRDSLYVPKNFKDIKGEDIEKAKSWAINSIFKFRYFYNKELGLLGVYGIPDATQKIFDGSVYFQNSCDQDYNKKDWDGIKAFEDIYEKWMTVDVDKVKEKYNNREYSVNDFDSEYPDPIKKSKALMYYRKSFCYEEIWSKFENTLYDDETAIYFSPFGFYDIAPITAFVKFCYEEYKKKSEKWAI